MKIVLSLVFCLTVSLAEMVRVTEHIKITKTYLDKVKIGEQCYEKPVKVPMSCGKDTNAVGLDTLVGIGLGVAIGNQFKNNKDTAKVIGGLSGGYIANKMRNANCYSYEVITECKPQYDYRQETKVVGWNNCIYIDGQRYCKRSKDKIKYLNIKKTVTILN